MPGTRNRTKSYHKSFKLSKRINSPVNKQISSVFGLLRYTWRHMWQYRRSYFGIVAVYILLQLILVKGLSSTIDIVQTRKDYIETLGLSGFSLQLALFGNVAVSTNANTNELANTYYSIITIVVTLAFIWLFRRTNELPQKSPKVKLSFYEGMQPLIPFLLVFVVVSLQLVPMLAGLGIYTTVQSNGLASTTAELIVWGLLAALLSLLTLYLVSSSLFALIIVTLPHMTPINALRLARKVVAYRRLLLMRKLFGITAVLLLINASLTLATIMLVPNLAEWIWFLASTITLPVAIGSVYKLYRELL